MGNVDQALEEHLRELHEFYIAGVRSDLSDSELSELALAFDEAAARPIPRGRPPAWQSKNERTYQSAELFVFVTGEFQTFRRRLGIQYVPARVREAIIEFAKKLYPQAKSSIFREHLRKDQRLLPSYEEPTCFLLVDFEWEEGRTVYVVLAAPSDERRSRCPNGGNQRASTKK